MARTAFKPKAVSGLGGNERAVELDDRTVVKLTTTRTETDTQITFKIKATRVGADGKLHDFRGRPVESEAQAQQTARTKTVMKEWLAGDPEARTNDALGELTAEVVDLFYGNKVGAELWSVFPEEPGEP